MKPLYMLLLALAFSVSSASASEINGSAGAANQKVVEANLYHDDYQYMPVAIPGLVTNKYINGWQSLYSKFLSEIGFKKDSYVRVAYDVADLGWANYTNKKVWQDVAAGGANLMMPIYGTTDDNASRYFGCVDGELSGPIRQSLPSNPELWAANALEVMKNLPAYLYIIWNEPNTQQTAGGYTSCSPDTYEPAYAEQYVDLTIAVVRAVKAYNDTNPPRKINLGVCGTSSLGANMPSMGGGETFACPDTIAALNSEGLLGEGSPVIAHHFHFYNTNHRLSESQDNALGIYQNEYGLKSFADEGNRGSRPDPFGLHAWWIAKFANSLHDVKNPPMSLGFFQLFSTRHETGTWQEGILTRGILSLFDYTGLKLPLFYTLRALNEAPGAYRVGQDYDNKSDDLALFALRDVPEDPNKKSSTCVYMANTNLTEGITAVVRYYNLDPGVRDYAVHRIHHGVYDHEQEVTDSLSGYLNITQGWEDFQMVAEEDINNMDQLYGEPELLTSGRLKVRNGRVLKLSVSIPAGEVVYGCLTPVE